jgi:hypothetical protein
MSGGIARLTPDDRVTHPFGSKNADLAPMHILPGDRAALAVRKNLGTANGGAFLLDLETGEATPLIEQNVVDIKYARGFLVYALTNGNLEAQPFDLPARKTTGSPVTIATGVSLTGTGVAQFDVAANGTVVYVPEDPRSLVLVDRSGAMRAAVGENHNYHSPRFSPDGQRVAVDFTSPDGRDVGCSAWRRTLTRTTFLGDGHDPTWTLTASCLPFLDAERTLGITGPPGRPPGGIAFASAQLRFRRLAAGPERPDHQAPAWEGGSRADIGIVRNGGRGPIELLCTIQGNPAVSPTTSGSRSRRRSQPRGGLCAASTARGVGQSPLGGRAVWGRTDGNCSIGLSSSVVELRRRRSRPA